MAEESALGKPIGGDLREGKVTLPIILLIQRAGPEVQALVNEVIAEGRVTPEKWRLIKDLLARHGAIEAAFERAVTHAARAKEQLLAAFPASAERDGLVSLADYIISRDR
jgi:octaprenyl-diphosphate synthase